MENSVNPIKGRAINRFSQHLHFFLLSELMWITTSLVRSSFSSSEWTIAEDRWLFAVGILYVRTNYFNGLAASESWMQNLHLTANFFPSQYYSVIKKKAGTHKLRVFSFLTDPIIQEPQNLRQDSVSGFQAGESSSALTARISYFFELRQTWASLPKSSRRFWSDNLLNERVLFVAYY